MTNHQAPREAARAELRDRIKHTPETSEETA